MKKEKYIDYVPMKMNTKSRKYYPVENPFKFSIRIYLRAKSIKHHLPWRPTLQDAIADRERVLALKNDMSVSVFCVEEEIMAIKAVPGICVSGERVGKHTHS